MKRSELLILVGIVGFAVAYFSFVAIITTMSLMGYWS